MTITSLGLMSGTSMDGIEAVIIKTDGDIAIEEIAQRSLDYDARFKLLLKAAEYAVRCYEGNLQQAATFFQECLDRYLRSLLAEHELVDTYQALRDYLQQDLSLTAIIQHSTDLHAQLCQALLAQTHETIDVIGYHGQALWHQPAHGFTIQVGDGQRLASMLNVTVVDDFRTNDIKHGGQGAPLAPIYHQALAMRDHKIPLAVVNCGGIANITLITGNTEHDLIGFDVGPGNSLLDQWVKRCTQMREQMDQDGRYSSQGKVNASVLAALQNKSGILNNGVNYLHLLPPKSLDISHFKLIDELASLSLPDACATLAAFTASCIVNSLDLLEGIKTPTCWVLAGGGWRNPSIVRELETRLHQKLGESVQIQTADSMGWNSTTLEAQIFAYLAVRCLQKKPFSVPGTTGVKMPVSGGKIHLPKTGATSKVAQLMQELV